MTDPLSTLADRVAKKLVSAPPHVVGIGGAVAVGKSTVAQALAERFAARGRRVQIVATDAFLYPNAELEERGLTLRKGFPETFDFDSMLAFISEIRSGSAQVSVPVYSHEIYDILPGERDVISSPDLVLLEGVIALQSPVVDAIDVAIYVDAEEREVRAWFVTRFLELTEAARSDAESFYRIFADMSLDEVRSIAEATWDSINGVNLREHIGPSRERATFIVSKAGDHSIARIVDRQG